jgi:hypothetical protein
VSITTITERKHMKRTVGLESQNGKNVDMNIISESSIIPVLIKIFNKIIARVPMFNQLRRPTH